MLAAQDTMQDTELDAGPRSGGAGTERAALAALSPQEKRVLALIADGRTNKEAGAELHLSEKTVKNYLSNIFDKLKIEAPEDYELLMGEFKTAKEKFGAIE